MSKGSRVKAQKQAASLARETSLEHADKPSSKPTYNAFTNPKNINWVLLSGAMAVTVLVLMFLPQQLGSGLTSVYSIMLWTGLFGATLSRYLGKNGWMGFLTGSIVGMVIHIFAPVIIAVLR
jgi:VIT1/CCC1 family predicted Fe2+/Mn2+ transporter